MSTIATQFQRIGPSIASVLWSEPLQTLVLLSQSSSLEALRLDRGVAFGGKLIRYHFTSIDCSVLIWFPLRICCRWAEEDGGRGMAGTSIGSTWGYRSSAWRTAASYL
jgi:hypothetical protein